MTKLIDTYFVDGGTANNGDFGNQKSFICVTYEDGQEILLEEIGDKTNNEAELLAILKCLKLHPNPKVIFSDSKLCVNLVKKLWKTKIPRLQKILHDIWDDSSSLGIFWKPREENKAGWIIEEKFGL